MPSHPSRPISSPFQSQPIVYSTASSLSGANLNHIPTGFADQPQPKPYSTLDQSSTNPTTSQLVPSALHLDHRPQSQLRQDCYGQLVSHTRPPILSVPHHQSYSPRDPTPCFAMTDGIFNPDHSGPSPFGLFSSAAVPSISRPFSLRYPSSTFPEQTRQHVQQTWAAGDEAIEWGNPGQASSHPDLLQNVSPDTSSAAQQVPTDQGPSCHGPPLPLNPPEFDHRTFQQPPPPSWFIDQVSQPLVDAQHVQQQRKQQSKLGTKASLLPSTISPTLIAPPTLTDSVAPSNDAVFTDSLNFNHPDQPSLFGFSPLISHGDNRPHETVQSDPTSVIPADDQSLRTSWPSGQIDTDGIHEAATTSTIPDQNGLDERMLIPARSEVRRVATRLKMATLKGPSCHTCRRGHRGCDGMRPCSRCHDRGPTFAAECKDAEDSPVTKDCPPLALAFTMHPSYAQPLNRLNSDSPPLTRPVMPAVPSAYAINKATEAHPERSDPTHVSCRTPSASSSSSTLRGSLRSISAGSPTPDKETPRATSSSVSRKSTPATTVKLSTRPRPHRPAPITIPPSANLDIAASNAPTSLDRPTMPTVPSSHAMSQACLTYPAPSPRPRQPPMVTTTTTKPRLRPQLPPISSLGGYPSPTVRSQTKVDAQQGVLSQHISQPPNPPPDQHSLKRKRGSVRLDDVLASPPSASFSLPEPDESCDSSGSLHPSRSPIQLLTPLSTGSNAQSGCHVSVASALQRGPLSAQPTELRLTIPTQLYTQTRQPTGTAWGIPHRHGVHEDQGQFGPIGTGQLDGYLGGGTTLMSHQVPLVLPYYDPHSRPQYLSYHPYQPSSSYYPSYHPRAHPRPAHFVARHPSASSTFISTVSPSPDAGPMLAHLASNDEEELVQHDPYLEPSMSGSITTSTSNEEGRGGGEGGKSRQSSGTTSASSSSSLATPTTTTDARASPRQLVSYPIVLNQRTMMQIPSKKRRLVSVTDPFHPPPPSHSHQRDHLYQPLGPPPVPSPLSYPNSRPSTSGEMSLSNAHSHLQRSWPPPPLSSSTGSSLSTTFVAARPYPMPSFPQATFEPKSRLASDPTTTTTTTNLTHSSHPYYYHHHQQQQQSQQQQQPQRRGRYPSSSLGSTLIHPHFSRSSHAGSTTPLGGEFALLDPSVRLRPPITMPSPLTGTRTGTGTRLRFRPPSPIETMSYEAYLAWEEDVRNKGVHGEECKGEGEGEGEGEGRVEEKRPRSPGVGGRVDDGGLFGELMSRMKEEEEEEEEGRRAGGCRGQEEEEEDGKEMEGKEGERGEEEEVVKERTGLEEPVGSRISDREPQEERAVSTPTEEAKEEEGPLTLQGLGAGGGDRLVVLGEGGGGLVVDADSPLTDLEDDDDDGNNDNDSGEGQTIERESEDIRKKVEDNDD